MSDQPRPARRFGQSRSRSRGVCPFGRDRRGHTYNRRSRQHTAFALTVKPGGRAKAARPTGPTRHCIHSDGEALCGRAKDVRQTGPARVCVRNRGTARVRRRQKYDHDALAGGRQLVERVHVAERARAVVLAEQHVARTARQFANTRAIGSSTPGGAGCWMLVIAPRRLSSCRMRLLTNDGESCPVVKTTGGSRQIIPSRHPQIVHKKQPTEDDPVPREYHEAVLRNEPEQRLHDDRGGHERRHEADR